MAGQYDHLPKPKDLSHHISLVTKARAASRIKEFYKYLLIPGIGQLAAGLPNDNYFPYDTLEAQAALPNRWKPTPNKPVNPPIPQPSQNLQSNSELPSSHLVVPKSAGTTNVLRKIDLSSALQYGLAQGYPPLFEFCHAFATAALHPNIPYKGGAEVILTCGNTDGFNKALQCLNNEWVEGRDSVAEREGMLVEEYAYMNAVQTARPRGLTVTPVRIDNEGMCAEGPRGLRDVLENWDLRRGMRPHLLYTVTIGQNPTSGVLSLKRRCEIYALCQKYDIIIIEDDPYWFLQYPSSGNVFTPPASHPSLPSIPWKNSGYSFLDSLVPSYLSIDVDGRVIRLDTFSKVVAPGCRLGWITAQPLFIERLLRITDTSTQQPSGFVQSIIAELVIGPPPKKDKDGHESDPPARGGAEDGSGWGFGGWVRWLEGLRGNYERRMNVMCDVLEEWRDVVKAGRRRSLDPVVGVGWTGALCRESEVRSSKLAESEEMPVVDDEEWYVVEKARIYDFVRPMGGMFIWVRFDFTSHPLASKIPHARLSRALWVFWTTKAYRVLVSPGMIFATTPEVRDNDGYNCFRLCFAACPEEQVKPISKRFGRGAQAFWRIKDVKEIEKLLEGDEETVVKGMGGDEVGLLTCWC